MEIKRNGSQASVKGPGDWFTGMVRINPVFQIKDPAASSGDECRHLHKNDRMDAK
jgi:hypothetical protein